MSPVIGDFQSEGERQLSLSFDPGLTQRYGSVRECVAAGVFKRGLGRVAAAVDMSPGNLSQALSQDGKRHLSCDTMERYMRVTGDLTPVRYLVAAFLDQGEQANRDDAMERLQEMVGQITELLAAAGGGKKKGAKR